MLVAIFFIFFKYFLATSLLSSRQAYFCRGKTRLCRDKSMLVATNTYLSQQMFVTLVATKELSRQAYFCRDDKRRILSRQTH